VVVGKKQLFSVAALVCSLSNAAGFTTCSSWPDGAAILSLSAVVEPAQGEGECEVTGVPAVFRPGTEYVVHVVCGEFPVEGKCVHMLHASAGTFSSLGCDDDICCEEKAVQKSTEYLWTAPKRVASGFVEMTALCGR
jgi:hypothetical protein